MKDVCSVKGATGVKFCTTISKSVKAVKMASTKTNEVDQARAIVEAIGMVDPTGISDCAAAYMYPPSAMPPIMPLGFSNIYILFILAYIKHVVSIYSK